ncbi:MAG: porin family protein [Aliishimia sp.]
MIYRIISLGCAISLGLIALKASAQEAWSGAYMGISLNANDADAGIQGSTASQFGDSSVGLGLFGGYNIVRGNGFVWGPEVHFSGLSSSGGASDPTYGNTKMEGSFLLSPRVRGGYATDKMYLYGVLGLGISDLTVQASGTDDVDVTISSAIGVGAEFAMGQGWAPRIEAMHYDFDGRNFSSGGTTSPVQADVNQVTLGLSRKF